MIHDHFARYALTASAFSPDSNEGQILLELAWLASYVVSEGHICVHLGDLEGKNRSEILMDLGSRQIDDDKEYLVFPLVETILEVARQADSVVGFSYRDGQVPSKLMVIDEGNRLYLQKYFVFERNLAEEIRGRTALSPMDDCEAVQKAVGVFRRLFPYTRGGFDWQDFASWLSLQSRLLVVSGGPGTGKTTTVSRIIALNNYLHGQQKKGGELEVALCAPTGKAAARMGEAVEQVKARTQEAVDQSGDSLLKEVWNNLPVHASTIHRLLGPIKGSPFFRRNSVYPLSADIVVVDEASMVPLPLMTRLFEALKPSAKIVLLGDMNQLASVQPGYVLGDICASSVDIPYSAQVCEAYEAASGTKLPDRFIGPRRDEGGLYDCSVVLDESYRFPVGGVIDRVSRAVNAARKIEDGFGVVSLLESLSKEEQQTLCFQNIQVDSRGRWLTPWVEEKIVQGFARFMKSNDPLQVLEGLLDFRIISALRKGRQGVGAINAMVESVLFGEKNAAQPKHSSPHARAHSSDFFYDHRPVMVVENDYNLQLFNGDVGVALRDEKGVTKVWFEDPDSGSVRSFSPSALPTVETCFAQTVHKSQGSEFGSLLFVLPDKDSPVLTRELIYTAITRSIHRAFILGSPEVLSLGLVRSSRCNSGLSHLL